MPAKEAVTSDFTDLPNQLLLFALSVFVLVLSLFPFQEADAFQGLATGLDVLREGIATGGFDWFHDLIVALVFRGNGAAGIVILRAIGMLMFSILAFGFLLARGLPPATASLALGLCLISMFSILTAGPILSGILFAGGLFFMLVRGPGRGVQWTLPILFLLWANTAGSTVLPGLLGCLVYTLGLLLTPLVTREELPEGNRKHRSKLMIGVALSFVAVLLQPATTSVYQFPPPTAPVLNPLFFPVYLAPLLVLITVSFVAGAPRRIPHLATALALTVGGLLFGGAWASTLSAAFPFLLAPMAAPAAAFLPRERIYVFASTAVFLLGAAWVCFVPGRRPGLGMDETGYPAEAVRQWVAKSYPAPVYCEPPIRGYVAYRLAGRSGQLADSHVEARSWIALPAAGPRLPDWEPAEKTVDGQIWVRSR